MVDVRIDRSLGAHKCVICTGALDDADFIQAGVLLTTAGVFIDYHCRECGHRGRYMINGVDPEPAWTH